MHKVRRANVALAIERLQRLLSSGLDISTFRGKANRAAVCKQIGIARSTANANPEISRLFEMVDCAVMNQKQKVIEADGYAQSFVESSILEEELLQNRRRHFLLTFGRIVR